MIDNLYSEIARTVSKFSKAERTQVGAILVSREGKIIGTGYNGTPIGVDNKCETEDGSSTVEHVIHAELNAIFNATTHDLEDSTLYVTLSPCVKCSSAIIQKKIKRVVYQDDYRILEGVEFLRKHGVEVEQLSKTHNISSDINNEIGQFNAMKALQSLHGMQVISPMSIVELKFKLDSIIVKKIAQLSDSNLQIDKLIVIDYMLLVDFEKPNSIAIRLNTFESAIIFNESLQTILDVYKNNGQDLSYLQEIKTSKCIYTKIGHMSTVNVQRL